MSKKTAPPNNQPNRRQFGSITAAADRLGVSPRTVRRMISRGEITAYRVGQRLLRVDLNEVETVLRRVPSAGGSV